MSESNAQLLSLYGPVYGALYFAVVMSTALYGIACVQTFHYYVQYQKDNLRLKIFIAALWVLNTAHVALAIAGVYEYIISGLLSNRSLNVIGSSELFLLWLLTALVAVPTQGFFVYRLYNFGGKYILGPLIWIVLALVQLVCPTVYVAGALATANSAQSASTILLSLYLFVAATVDILIAIFMTFLLLRQWASISFTSTAHILQRLMVFAVNTGTWTAIFAILSVIFLFVFPSNLMYAVFAIPICPLYCNTLLANLNARAYIRGEEDTVRTELTTWRVAHNTTVVRQGEQDNSTSSALESVGKTTQVATFTENDRSATAVNV